MRLPEWLVERGIGETRAALVERGEIIEARIELEGAVPAGTVLGARLRSTGRNAVATDDQQREYLLPPAPAGVTEGAALNIEVTREAIPGAEPWKRPLARQTDQPPGEAPALAERLNGRALPFPPATSDELADAGWLDLLGEAQSKTVDFPGGTLRVALTPAMTLIDVDGWLEPAELAVAGAAAAAKAIRRLDISGSIGVDLPTVGGRAERQAAAAAIDAHLPSPFERTAVNGFGFVQIVRPRIRPSLLQIFDERASSAARTLLRRSALEGPGAKRLVVSAAVATVLEAKAHWLRELERQIGGAVALRVDAAVPIFGEYAENA